MTYYYSSVWKRFVALDPNGTGMVDKIGFQVISLLSCVCIYYTYIPPFIGGAAEPSTGNDSPWDRPTGKEIRSVQGWKVVCTFGCSNSWLITTGLHDRISYVAFIQLFKPLDQTYRVGNNMGSLLSHRNGDATDELKVDFASVFVLVKHVALLSLAKTTSSWETNKRSSRSCWKSEAQGILKF